MRMLDSLAAAMGRPQALRVVGRPGRTSAAIGRWRHGGACLDRADADAVHLVFNVSGGQRVELRWPDRRLRRTVAAGSVAVMPLEGPTGVTVASAADAVHILIGNDWLTATSPVSAACPFRLQAVGARALVLLSGGGTAGVRGDADAIVRQVADLFARPGAPAGRVRRGGLAPAVRRRVRVYIDARLEADRFTPPCLGELAAVAGLSVGHFVKAFGESEGQTPYAAVNGRRIGRAVSMLLRPDARVDRLSHQLGFCSPAHFVSAFRRLVGVTPGAVRDAARARA